jgi:hypothetical protein
MIRVSLVVAGVVASGMGCAQLAGIDSTSGSGRNGDSLTVTRMSVGSTVVTAPLDLTGLAASYLVPAATPGSFDRLPAIQAPSKPGMWTQDLPDPASVEFTLPDVPTPLPRLYAFPNRALSVLFGVLEHPNRAPALDTAMLTVTAPLDVAAVATDSFQVYTVGSWTSHALANPGPGVLQVGPISYAFNVSNSLSGRPQLDSLTVNDAFLVLRYAGAGLTGVAEAPPFDQTGTDMVVTSKMVSVVQDQMLDVKVSPPALAMRYAAVRPAVAAPVTMNWSLVAAPGYRIASGSGPALQSGSLMAADVGVSVKYGNPFTGRDWHTILTLATSESRVVMPPAVKLPATLSAGMNQFIEPSLVAPGFALTEPAGLPVLISIDGQQLSTDGRMIAAPTKFVEVTFLPDNTNATVFNLQVFDLVPNAAATALENHIVFAATGNEAKFEVPPEILQPNHSYTLRAFCTYEGYPTVAGGDFTNRQLPLSQSYLDSGVFTVMP